MVVFPDLVIENILWHMSSKDRASTRLISSKWDLVVMTRFKNKKRLILRESADYKKFVETFSCAKYGIPFRKFSLAPEAGTVEDFLAFANLVGSFVVELTADSFHSDGGPSWPLIKELEGTNQSGNTIISIFRRLNLLLKYTLNLEYLGISTLPRNTIPISADDTIIPHLPKLRAFSGYETERFSAWYEVLLQQSPQLQKAKKINSSELTTLQRQDLSKLDPCNIIGQPLKILLSVEIRRTEDESISDNKFRADAENAMMLYILCFPNVTGEQKILRLPFHRFPALTDLCYREFSNNDHGPLIIQNGQFPALRRVVLNVRSNFVGKYPFEGCVFPTVEVLTLVMDEMEECKHWNLQTIFPNLSTLSIYTRFNFGENQLKDLLWSFGGSTSIKILLIQNASSCKLNWSNLLGFSKNHLCKSDTKIQGIKQICATSNCPSVIRLVFPAVTFLKVRGVILNEFLPMIIRSIRSGSFPVLQWLTLSGQRGADYSDEDVPNVDDYKVILEAMFKIVK